MSFSLLFVLCCVATAHQQHLLTSPEGLGLLKAPAAGGASSLLTGLTCYWKMDEASGNRADSSGAGQTFIDDSSVPSAAGKIGNAVDCSEGSTDDLSIADNATVSTGNIDFTFSAWVYVPATNAVSLFFCKDDISTSGREYQLGYDNSGTKFYWLTGRSGSTSTDMITGPSGVLAATWYHLVAWHDAAGGSNWMVINNGTPIGAARTTGPPDGTAPVYIAHLGGAPFYTCRVDELGFWKRKLTAGEITSLYNSGSGLTYPF